MKKIRESGVKEEGHDYEQGRRRNKEEMEKRRKEKRTERKRGRGEACEKCSSRSKEDRVFHCLGRRKFSVKIAPLTPLASLMRIRVPVRNVCLLDSVVACVSCGGKRRARFPL